MGILGLLQNLLGQARGKVARGSTRFLHFAATRNSSQRHQQQHAATTTSVRIRSIVKRTALVPHSQPRRQPLRKALAQLAPQQARRRARGFLHPAVSSTSWRTFSSTCFAPTWSRSASSSKEWRVRTKVDPDVPILLVGALIEERPIASDPHQPRFSRPTA